jgi:hypothetical protein
MIAVANDMHIWIILVIIIIIIIGDCTVFIKLLCTAVKVISL